MRKGYDRNCLHHVLEVLNNPVPPPDLYEVGPGALWDVSTLCVLFIVVHELASYSAAPFAAPFAAGGLASPSGDVRVSRCYHAQLGVARHGTAVFGTPPAAARQLHPLTRPTLPLPLPPPLA